jgi:phosphate/sulfate permease
VYSTDSVPHSQETPLWILFYGAAGACVGFWTMGHRVIGTVGSEFTDLDPYCGFCVELGTAMTVKK